MTAALLSFSPSFKEGVGTTSAGKVLQSFNEVNSLPGAEYHSFYSTKGKTSKFLSKNYAICCKKKGFFNERHHKVVDQIFLFCVVQCPENETEELRKQESLIKPATKEIEKELKASAESQSHTSTATCF